MGDDDNHWGDLGFAEEGAVFKGPTQNARVLSEGWVADRLFCPGCGSDRLEPFPNNSPVADFACPVCAEEYELKAKKGPSGRKIVNGALGAMTARLAARNNPNLLVMGYDGAANRVTDLIVVPKHFFTPSIIEPRRPLGPHARRAGWQGCNILIGAVPAAGRIPLITRGVHVPRATVLEQWRATLFLREEGTKARGWLLDVMKCVEDVGRAEFTLADVYAFEPRLAALYPGNRNVRPKIRQQLQVLRDRGWLEFNGRGTYRRAG